jgi:hypothetical protein
MISSQLNHLSSVLIVPFLTFEIIELAFFLLFLLYFFLCFNIPHLEDGIKKWKSDNDQSKIRICPIL